MTQLLKSKLKSQVSKGNIAFYMNLTKNSLIIPKLCKDSG